MFGICRHLTARSCAGAFTFHRALKNASRIPVTQRHIFAMSTEPALEAKRLKEDITIGTHSGVFHCDEILACYMLQQLPRYAAARIVRSRDTKVLDQCDIVVDVGGVFDRTRNRFDHHQGTFTDTLRTLRPELGVRWDIRLSSAGLVYAFFGEEVITEVLKAKTGKELAPDNLRAIYLKVYDGFVAEIDAIDNGVPMFEGGEPRYNISTHLSARVSHFNPSWNDASSDEDAMARFEQAKEYVGKEFLDKVLFYAERWWPARHLVETALKQRFAVHESGEILELTQFCPWKEHLYQLEEKHETVGVPKYVLYMNAVNDWRVICVPNQPSSFVCRKFLAKPWRGVRDADLETVSGIAGSTFCHQTGFIGGNKTRDGALQMAIASLAAEE